MVEPDDGGWGVGDTDSKSLIQTKFAKISIDKLTRLRLGLGA